MFHPELGRTREKTVSIELRAPNGSNLRDQTLAASIDLTEVFGEMGVARGPVGEACRLTVNVVQTLCDLSESSDEVFRSSETGQIVTLSCNIWRAWGDRARATT